MVPAGQITDDTVGQLHDLLEAGDTIIDGGNSNYKDSLRHAEFLKAKGIHFVDVGTSGGIWGLKEGYSLMVGGDDDVVRRHYPIFQTLAPAPDKGWGYVGQVGAGHFVKMIHNGIEYGLMQSYAEGFAIMRAKQAFELDLYQISEIWRVGSVVRSWLLDLTAQILKENQDLAGVEGYVMDSGEGRWAVFESIDLDVPAPVITLALQTRIRSRETEPYAEKLLAELRNQFGGHPVRHAAQREQLIPQSQATAERPTGEAKRQEQAKKEASPA
jgi:6-phosphogluconate dehydrogenase